MIAAGKLMAGGSTFSPASLTRLCLPSSGSSLAFAAGCAPASLARLYLSAGTRETRKPRLPYRSPGPRQMRDADRQNHAGKYQLPPRTTRSEPVAGPVGSSVGDFA